MKNQSFGERIHKFYASHVIPFYREFPYRGNLTFPRADARGAVSLDDRFFYNRVPKAANTTVLSTLQKIRLEDIGEQSVVSLQSYFMRPSHVSIQDIKAIRDQFFKFTFVRNPYTRTLSAYLDKISVGHGPIWKRWAAKHQTRTVPSFKSFCHYLAGPGLWDDAHWAPQTDSMLLPLECFDKIGKFEALNADLEFVLQKIYPQKAIAMKIGGDRVTDANSKLTIYYDEECIAIVKNRFERDFENFHYSNDFKDAIRNEVQ